MLPMPFAPARSNGDTAPTVQTRSNRPCESRLICTASNTTCRIITPASSTSDLCREGIPAIVLRSPFSLQLSVVSYQLSSKDVQKAPEPESLCQTIFFLTDHRKLTAENCKRSEVCDLCFFSRTKTYN